MSSVPLVTAVAQLHWRSLSAQVLSTYLDEVHRHLTSKNGDPDLLNWIIVQKDRILSGGIDQIDPYLIPAIRGELTRLDPETAWRVDEEQKRQPTGKIRRPSTSTFKAVRPEPVPAAPPQSTRLSQNPLAQRETESALSDLMESLIKLKDLMVSGDPQTRGHEVSVQLLLLQHTIVSMDPDPSATSEAGEIFWIWLSTNAEALSLLERLKQRDIQNAFAEQARSLFQEIVERFNSAHLRYVLKPLATDSDRITERPQSLTEDKDGAVLAAELARRLEQLPYSEKVSLNDEQKSLLTEVENILRQVRRAAFDLKSPLVQSFMQATLLGHLTMLPMIVKMIENARKKARSEGPDR